MDDGTPSSSHRSADSGRRLSFPWLRLVTAACLSIGKSSPASLKLDELLWWLHHKPLVDNGDKPWDLLQVLTFVGTNGAYFPQRHTSLTADGYLLTSHRLVQLPSDTRSKIYDRHYFTASTFLSLYLHYLWRWISLLLLAHGPSARGVAEQSTLHKSVHEPQLLAVESTKAGSGYTGLYTTPGEGEFDLLPPPGGGGGDSRGLPPDSPSLRGGGGGPPPSVLCEEPKKLVVFQHGLLESSLSWIVPLWSSDTEPLDIFQRLLTLPWRLCYNLCHYLTWHQLSCLWPRRPTEKTYAALKHSLPFNILLSSADESLDVWLTNTRGNEFTIKRSEKEEVYHRPIGYRPLTIEDLRRIFKVYDHEQWTYVDSAILDCESFYSMFVHHYNSYNLQIAVVSFSQGCAAFALNAALKNYAKPPPSPSPSPSPNPPPPQEFSPSPDGYSSSPDFPLEEMTMRTGGERSAGGRTGGERSVGGRTGGERSGGGRTGGEGRRISADASPLSADALPLSDAPLAPAPPCGLGGSVWSSGIFSVDGSSSCSPCCRSVEVSMSRHSSGLCGGLGECEICGIIPSSLILISPPLMLKHIDAAPRLRRGAAGWLERGREILCSSAWSYLHWIVLFVEIVQSLLHVRLGIVGHVFVRYVLKFNLFPLHKDVANLAYRLTPSGMTTRKNMELWKQQMTENQSLGNLLPFTPPTLNYLKHIWNLPLQPPTAINLSSYLPSHTHIYAALNDNIADTVRGADYLMREGEACLRLIDLNEELVEFDRRAKVSVNLLAGGSHLDIIWPSAKFRRLQNLITQDVLNTFLT